MEQHTMDKPIVIKTLPLFPLKTVLFPHGPLSLKVFEPRYLDMLSNCEKTDCGFGVFLINEGDEVGQAPVIYPVGTLVKVSYWEKRNDGLLGITLKGEHKIRILDQWVLANQLTLADVEVLKQEVTVELPEQYIPMANVLKSIIGNLQHPYITLEKKYNDVLWVGSRLCELLPLPQYTKQQLLELQEPMRRLSMLYDEMLTMGMISE
jgi:Lon protease-like protein